MHRRFLAGCALGAACLVSEVLAAGAQTPAPAPSATALPEIGRVATSDRRVEPLDRTSRPTFVLDIAQLRALGAKTVADALETLPGVELYRYGPFGALADVGLRGASGAQTLILLDGIPIAAASAGSVDLGSIPLTGVERIEVVESGSSTLYGTSAMGGAINIVTAPPRRADATLAAGSYGERDAQISAGDGRVGLSVERHLAQNGYGYPAFDYGGTIFPAGSRNNAWAQQSDGRFSLDQPIGGGFALRAGAGTATLDAGVPGRLDFLTPDAVQTTARNDANVELSHAGAHSLLSLTAAGSRQTIAYTDPLEGGETDTYDGRVQVSLKDVISGTRSSLVSGVDLARESVLESLGPFGPPSAFSAAQSQAAAYVADQIGVASNALVSVGLRGENDAPHGGVLAPSFGATFRAGVLRVAGNVGESFRVPSLDDLYYPGFSNPNLVPERAREEDVTLAAPLGGGVSLGWFGRSGSNFIVLGPSYVPENIGLASVAGIVLTAASRPFNGFVADVNLTNLYRANDLTSGARLPHDPVMQAALGLTHPFAGGKFALGIRARILGSDGDAGLGSGPDNYDAYTTADAYLRYALAPHAILTLRARNLGDAHYAPIAGYPAPGRTWEAEVSTH